MSDTISVAPCGRCGRREVLVRPDGARLTLHDDEMNVACPADRDFVLVWQEGEEEAPAPVELRDFLSDNLDDPRLCLDVQGLSPGQSLGGGGGAAPTFIVTRLEKPDRASWNIGRGDAQGRADWTSEPVHCPFCGTRRIVRDMVVWRATSVEDPENTGHLVEHQCDSCGGRSFWT